MNNNVCGDTTPSANEVTEFLELREVNVARGDRVVLHDIELTIRAGEHVAILGPTDAANPRSFSP